MEIFKQFFAKKLKQARAQTSLTQAQLGEAAGVEPSTVSRWESGKDAPDDDRLPRIAKALGYKSIEELIGFEQLEAPATVGSMSPFELEKMLQENLSVRMSREERQLLKLFRSLAPDDRPSVLSLAESLAPRKDDKLAARRARS